MSQHELAQLNIAAMKEPLDSPGMAEFVAYLDQINALADVAPGFVWRLESDDGDATEFRPLGDMTLVNLSVWKDLAALSKTFHCCAEIILFPTCSNNLSTRQHRHYSRGSRA